VGGFRDLWDRACSGLKLANEYSPSIVWYDVYPCASDFCVYLMIAWTARCGSDAELRSSLLILRERCASSNRRVPLDRAGRSLSLRCWPIRVHRDWPVCCGEATGRWFVSRPLATLGDMGALDFGRNAWLRLCLEKRRADQIFRAGSSGARIRSNSPHCRFGALSIPRQPAWAIMADSAEDAVLRPHDPLRLSLLALLARPRGGCCCAAMPPPCKLNDATPRAFRQLVASALDRCRAA